MFEPEFVVCETVVVAALLGLVVAMFEPEFGGGDI